MLVVSRRRGQKIRIGEDIVVSIEKLTPSQATVGVEAPRDLKVLRDELAAARVDQFDPFAVPVTAAWLDEHTGVPRKRVNEQHFEWKVLSAGGDRFELEWNDVGQWLRLCVISALNGYPCQVAYWSRPSCGDIERVCRCLMIKPGKTWQE